MLSPLISERTPWRPGLNKEKLLVAMVATYQLSPSDTKLFHYRPIFLENEIFHRFEAICVPTKSSGKKGFSRNQHVQKAGTFGKSKKSRPWFVGHIVVSESHDTHSTPP